MDVILKIELPFPPSVNHYWGSRSVGRRGIQRYIAAAGKQFRRDAILSCIAQGVPKGLDCLLRCTIDLHPPSLHRRDCDNYPKGILDALGHAGVYLDDSQIKDLRIRMLEKKPPGSAIVTLQEIREP